MFICFFVFFVFFVFFCFLVFGLWSLVFGLWSLVFGLWSLVFVLSTVLFQLSTDGNEWKIFSRVLFNCVLLFLCFFKVTFMSRKAMAFTCRLDFLDADGNRFTLAITGAADNCLLTTQDSLVGYSNR
jgi:hypothetical protein